MTDEKQALGPGRVRIEVTGRPRTKGSLIPTHRKVGPGACKVGLREDGEYSVAWKNTMINAVRRQCAIARYAGPVVVDTFFRFERESEDLDVLWPTGRQYGDEDKLRRNALDALTQSGLILDDSLVIGGRTFKRFPIEDERAGVVISVRPTIDTEFMGLLGLERS